MRRVLVLLAGIGLLGLAVGCKCGGCGCTAGVCDCDYRDFGCSYYGDPVPPATPLVPKPAGVTKPESIKEMPKTSDKDKVPEPK
jgi:hypothetical protein